MSGHDQKPIVLNWTEKTLEVPKFSRAFFCARSVRFEHGQKPVTCTDPRLANLVHARREHRNLQSSPVRFGDSRLPEVSFVNSNSRDGR
jgi:hypothetical protein